MGYREHTRTFVAGEALEPHRVVRPSATVEGEVTYVADGHLASYDGLLYVTLGGAPAGGSVAVVPLHDASRTFEVELAADVVDGAALYVKSGGKLDDDPTGSGDAVAAAVGDGVAGQTDFEACAIPAHMV